MQSILGNDNYFRAVYLEEVRETKIEGFIKCPIPKKMLDAGWHATGGYKEVLFPFDDNALKLGGLSINQQGESKNNIPTGSIYISELRMGIAADLSMVQSFSNDNGQSKTETIYLSDWITDGSIAIISYAKIKNPYKTNEYLGPRMWYFTISDAKRQGWIINITGYGQNSTYATADANRYVVDLEPTEFKATPASLMNEDEPAPISNLKTYSYNGFKGRPSQILNSLYFKLYNKELDKETKKAIDDRSPKYIRKSYPAGPAGLYKIDIPVYYEFILLKDKQYTTLTDVIKFVAMVTNGFIYENRGNPDDVQSLQYGFTQTSKYTPIPDNPSAGTILLDKTNCKNAKFTIEGGKVNFNGIKAKSQNGTFEYKDKTKNGVIFDCGKLSFMIDETSYIEDGRNTANPECRPLNDDVDFYSEYIPYETPHWDYTKDIIEQIYKGNYYKTISSVITIPDVPGSGTNTGLKAISYMPCQIEFLGDPALDLGDVIRYRAELPKKPDETEIPYIDIMVPIMSSNWTYHGRQTLSSNGQGSKMREAREIKSNNEENNTNYSITARSSKEYFYTNKNPQRTITTFDKDGNPEVHSLDKNKPGPIKFNSGMNKVYTKTISTKIDKYGNLFMDGLIKITPPTSSSASCNYKVNYTFNYTRKKCDSNGNPIEGVSNFEKKTDDLSIYDMTVKCIGGSSDLCIPVFCAIENLDKWIVSGELLISIEVSGTGVSGGDYGAISADGLKVRVSGDTIL